MGRTQAVYYRDRNRHEPVRAYVDALAPAPRESLRAQIAILTGLPPADPPPPFPITSQVAHGLRELRCHHGRDLHRILHRRSDNLIVLLHAFAKRSQRVPAREIAIAEARWLDLRTRIDAAPRPGPRPIGGDAP
ncbi:MAG: Phage derived protein Gp49-like [Actinomycetota bacterium]|jgi:phage-related protein